MTTKEKLANEYLTLRKEFDGDDFKENITTNQIWYLTSKFKVIDLKDKIDAVKRAIQDKEIRLKKEAYFETPEGKAFKENIEAKIEQYDNECKNIHDTFESWIISEVNKMVPGNWTALLNLSYRGGNVEIGLVNRDTKRNFQMQFGHTFTIYFDSYRFELNYGTLGSFDLFNDETRPLYLNGLATISNNKEWLQLLMAKFIENTQKADKLTKYVYELTQKLKNPFNN